MGKKCEKYHILYSNIHQIQEVGRNKSLVCYTICTPHIENKISQNFYQYPSLLKNNKTNLCVHYWNTNHYPYFETTFIPHTFIQYFKYLNTKNFIKKHTSFKILGCFQESLYLCILTKGGFICTYPLKTLVQLQLNSS